MWHNKFVSLPGTLLCSVIQSNLTLKLEECPSKSTGKRSQTIRAYFSSLARNFFDRRKRFLGGTVDGAPRRLNSRIQQKCRKCTSRLEFQKPQCQLMRMFLSSCTAKTPCEHTFWTRFQHSIEPGSEGHNVGDSQQALPLSIPKMIRRIFRAYKPHRCFKYLLS